MRSKVDGHRQEKQLSAPFACYAGCAKGMQAKGLTIWDNAKLPPKQGHLNPTRTEESTHHDYYVRSNYLRTTYHGTMGVVGRGSLAGV